MSGKQAQMPAGVYCSVNGCQNNARTYNGGFFRFPMDEERAKTWALLCDREDLVNRNAILHNYRICAKHFESKMFKNQKRRGLTATAYPTLFLFKGNIVPGFPHDEANEFSLESVSDKDAGMSCEDIRGLAISPNSSDSDTDFETPPKKQRTIP